MAEQQTQNTETGPRPILPIFKLDPMMGDQPLLKELHHHIKRKRFSE